VLRCTLLWCPISDLSSGVPVQLLFMFVELVVGIWTNSLGLISDAGHMFFDNASLFIGLYASYMSKWRKDDVFTYGCVARSA